MVAGVIGIIATFIAGRQTIFTWSAVSVGLGLAMGFFREAFRPRVRLEDQPKNEEGVLKTNLEIIIPTDQPSREQLLDRLHSRAPSIVSERDDMQRNALAGHFSWRFWLAAAGACVAAGLICLADFQKSRLWDSLTIPPSQIANAMINYPAWAATHFPGCPRIPLFRRGWLYIDSSDALFLVGVVLLWCWVGHRLGILFRQQSHSSGSRPESERFVINLLGIFAWSLAIFDLSNRLGALRGSQSLSGSAQEFVETQ